jgi:hypothetical protein
VILVLPWIFVVWHFIILVMSYNRTVPCLDNFLWSLE